MSPVFLRTAPVFSGSAKVGALFNLTNFSLVFVELKLTNPLCMLDSGNPRRLEPNTGLVQGAKSTEIITWPAQAAEVSGKGTFIV